MNNNNMQFGAEIFFWNVVIQLLGNLNKYKSNLLNISKFLLVTIAWAFSGFVIGLILSYLLTP